MRGARLYNFDRSFCVPGCVARRAGENEDRSVTTWRDVEPGDVRKWPVATYCTAAHLGRKRGIAEIDGQPSAAEGDARDPMLTPTQAVMAGPLSIHANSEQD